MKKLLLILLCLPLMTLGQGWTKTYGGIDYDLINHMDNVMGMTIDTLLDGAKKPTFASA